MVLLCVYCHMLQHFCVALPLSAWTCCFSLAILSIISLKMLARISSSMRIGSSNVLPGWMRLQFFSYSQTIVYEIERKSCVVCFCLQGMIDGSFWCCLLLRLALQSRPVLFALLVVLTSYSDYCVHYLQRAYSRATCAFLHRDVAFFLAIACSVLRTLYLPGAYALLLVMPKCLQFAFEV